nr:MAG TPA: hypothetical protein [Caudoviricetes sp.]
MAQVYAVIRAQGKTVTAGRDVTAVTLGISCHAWLASRLSYMRLHLPYGRCRRYYRVY